LLLPAPWDALSLTAFFARQSAKGSTAGTGSALSCVLPRGKETVVAELR
jgi:hypothetical protein